MSHQQPYQPYGPAPYQPPPPPKKGMSTGAIVAIVLGGVFGLFFLIIVIGVAVSGSDTTDNKPVGTVGAAPEPSTEAAADPVEPEQSPVKIVAKVTKFAPGVLHHGGAYTSVRITITNNGEKTIRVNPLYFTITDTNGTKHTAELAVDENQIDTVKLAPGENTSGAITGKGQFTPKYVTYTDGWFGEGVRSDVS